MNGQDIIDEINKEVRRVNITDKPNLTLTEKYPYWYVGVTNDPDERKARHKSEGNNVSHWRSWPASSDEIARSVEKYFKDRDMKGGLGGGDNTKYVYIF